MSGKQAICPDCGKPTVPTVEWDRLSEQERGQVCRCVVKIGGFSPEPPPIQNTLSTGFGQGYRFTLENFLVRVMGLLGVVIFLLGILVFILQVFFFFGRRVEGPMEWDPIGVFFSNPFQIFLDFTPAAGMIIGGSVMFLLARVGQLLRRA